MRKLVLLAVLAVAFALSANGANACANVDHTRVEQTVTDRAGFYFEQAERSHDHRAYHDHRTHDDRTPCDDGCCGCAASTGAALPALAETDYLAEQVASHRRQSPSLNPAQLTSDIYSPPKFFA